MSETYKAKKNKPKLKLKNGFPNFEDVYDLTY